MEETIQVSPDSLIQFTEKEMELPKRRHWLVDFLIQLVTTKPLGAFGGFLVLILVLTAVFAPFITSWDPTVILEPESRLLPPSKVHYFGTDDLARDVFARIVYGARVSLFVGIGATALSLLLATLVGVSSAAIGGMYDLVVQRIVDAWMSFPGLIILLTIMAILGPGMYNIIIAFAVASFDGTSRVIRSAVLGIRGSEYLLAARATGCTQWGIVIYHILPNIAAPIMILGTMGIGGAILAETSISFLGFGIPPPTPSWGRMLSLEGLPYMLKSPWLAIFPGVSISLTVFGFNMLGDAVRDLLDPKLTGSSIGRL
ncbi:MAG: ABC transporter permease [Candidatus Adiutricales bacterium]